MEDIMRYILGGSLAIVGIGLVISLTILSLRLFYLMVKELWDNL